MRKKQHINRLNRGNIVSKPSILMRIEALIAVFVLWLVGHFDDNNEGQPDEE